MSKITNKFKNYFLNKSNQYLYYKSEYTKLKKDLSVIQKKSDALETNNRELLKKIEELQKKNSQAKDEILNKKQRNLENIRTKNSCNLKNVSIGDYTYGNPQIKCYNTKDTLTIGNFCSIAENVTILIGMSHNMECATTFPYPYFPGNLPEIEVPDKIPEETIIGNDVWIGYDALILSGVTIGDGSIIGARTVVSKDVEPYSIVAGSPMKQLRYRFSKEVRDILLEKKWWDLPDEKIGELAPYLIQPDINKLLEVL